jgi:di/tricarboxylate transporter
VYVRLFPSSLHFGMSSKAHYFFKEKTEKRRLRSIFAAALHPSFKMLKRPTVVLSLFMITVVVVMGVVALFTNAFDSLLPGSRRWMFGGVMLAYAALRLVRLRKVIASEKEPNS